MNCTLSLGLFLSLEPISTSSIFQSFGLKLNLRRPVCLIPLLLAPSMTSSVTSRRSFSSVPQGLFGFIFNGPNTWGPVLELCLSLLSPPPALCPRMLLAFFFRRSFHRLIRLSPFRVLQLAPGLTVFGGVATSVSFLRNYFIRSVLESSCWKSASVVMSFYLSDVHFSFDGGFGLGPFVAASENFLNVQLVFLAFFSCLLFLSFFSSSSFSCLLLPLYIQFGSCLGVGFFFFISDM